MSPKPVIQDARRSTRIRLKVMIEARGMEDPVKCEGQTQVVNLHGALIVTGIPLRVGMKIEILVVVPNTRAAATVVYVDPDLPRQCGINLDEAKNIWGVALPPEDWLQEH